MIKAIRFLFNFYIEASIHVAFAVYALWYMFLKVNHFEYDEALAYTLFYGTITGYNFVKFAPVAKLYHKSLTQSLKLIQLFSLLCFFALLYYMVQLPVRTLLGFLVSLLVVLAYALPVFRKKNLRSISRLKIYMVAFCWTLVIVIVPAIHYQLEFTLRLYLQAFQLFVLVVALIIPFDIRDLKYDNVSLQTIPQKIGVKKSKYVAYLLLVSYLGLDFFLSAYYLWPAAFITVAIACILIHKMPKKPVKYYCSFGIESLPILKLLLVWAISRF